MPERLHVSEIQRRADLSLEQARARRKQAKRQHRINVAAGVAAFISVCLIFAALIVFFPR